MLCDCYETGYHGDFCSIRNIGCEDKICKNGGTCIKMADSDTACKCPVEFKGLLCEVRSYHDVMYDVITHLL